MIKRIMNTWKLNVSELYATLLFILVFEIIGIVIVAVVVKFDPESTYATLGTMLAALVGMFANLIFGILSLGCSFNTTVSFGSTRKEFLISEGVTAYINIIIEIAAIQILYFVETTLGRLLYVDRECEDLGVFLTDYRIVLALILLLPALRMLCGALLLKFKKIAYWCLWMLWMLLFMGFGYLTDYIAENPGSIVSRICTGVLDFVIGMSGMAQIAAVFVVACIFISVASIFIRRQSVEI